MAKITQPINLEVAKPNIFQALVAKQNDCNSRFLQVTLVHNGEKIEIEPTSLVTINADRNDGESKTFEGIANNDGTATVPLTVWMLELAGTLYCDVSIIDKENSKLTSTKFMVMVEEAACSDEDIEQSDDYDILTKLISEVRTTGMSGTVYIEDLPIGMSYALEDITLKYKSNAEYSQYSTLSVDSGSCIFKSEGRLRDYNDNLHYGAITVYIIPKDHSISDGFGNNSTWVMTKIVPYADAQYGVSYSVSEIKNELEIERNIFIDDPDYGSIHPNRVPSVSAVIDYVAANGAEASHVVFESFDLTYEDLQKVITECCEKGKPLAFKYWDNYGVISLVVCSQVYYNDTSAVVAPTLVLVFETFHNGSKTLRINRHGYEIFSDHTINHVSKVYTIATEA